MSNDLPPKKEETLDERIARLERHKVSAESENRKTTGHPGAQVSPEIEPSGS